MSIFSSWSIGLKSWKVIDVIVQHFLEGLVFPSLPVFREFKQLIANTNTGKVHLQGCRAVDMMSEEHMWYTDTAAGWSACSLCGAGPEPVVDTVLDDFRLDDFTVEDPEVIVRCRDPEIRKLFQGFTCDCGSHEGIVKMYEHPEGYRLTGKSGKWWLYIECSSCHHETSLRHHQNNKKALRFKEVSSCQCSG